MIIDDLSEVTNLNGNMASTSIKNQLLIRYNKFISYTEYNVRLFIEGQRQYYFIHHQCKH